MNPKIDAILRRMGFKCYNYHEDMSGKTAQYVNVDAGEIVSVIHSIVEDEDDWENIIEHLKQGEVRFGRHGNPWKYPEPKKEHKAYCPTCSAEMIVSKDKPDSWYCPKCYTNWPL